MYSYYVCNLYTLYIHIAIMLKSFFFIILFYELLCIVPMYIIYCIYEYLLHV